MGQLAIIADDLSSCTDCGIQIARSGLQTFVAIQPEQDFTRLARYDVIAIDTDSRPAPAVQAYERAREAARLVRPHFQHIYKSIDSTLRGNLGAEIDGVMDEIKFDLAVAAPAYPYYGRTSRDGIHYLHKRPIHLTEFASDPQRPVSDSDLINIFSAQSRRKVGHVRLETLRGGKAAIAARVTALCKAGTELVVFDAVTEPDLSRIVKSMAATGLRILWVGSTGLAGHISQILEPHPTDLGNTDIPTGEEKDSRILTVAGSTSKVTQGQLALLTTEAGITPVVLNSFAAIQTGKAREDEIGICRDKLINELADGYDVILQASSDRSDVAATQSFGNRLGLTALEVSARIAECLAIITRLVVEQAAPGGLILTGGDTARAVCCGLGAKGILILEEVEPGIPVAQVVGEREILIIIKAGGFGQTDTLLCAGKRLKAWADRAIQTRNWRM